MFGSLNFIIKFDNYFITKYGIIFLQNASDFLSQNALVLLHNATVITKRDGFIKKCDDYYKIGCSLQNALVQGQKSCLHNMKIDDHSVDPAKIYVIRVRRNWL